MSLLELKADVDADATLHLPDIIYDIQSNDHRMKFVTVPMEEYLEGEKNVVGLEIVREHEANYIFSRWSRQQLLALLGTKEKWFSYVDLECQAKELNTRLHALEGYNFRTAHAVDADFPVRFVRGVVSRVYSDIPNTHIMSAIISRMPGDAMSLRRYSGLTDRAFYAYVISPSPITIPGTSFFAYPGAVVRNSDVGFTSLYVIPMLVLKANGTPVVLETKAVLKRIHRGKVDLTDEFEKAFAKCASLWSDLATKLPYLASKQYPTSDAAVDAMSKLLASTLATKEFIHKCKISYQQTARRNTALDIFETITEVCATYDDRDENYVVGAIAGAVLFKLMF